MKKLLGKLENLINKSKAKLHAFLFRHDKINRIFTLVMMQLKNPKRLIKGNKLSDRILLALLKVVIFVGLFFIFKILFQIVPTFTYMNYATNYVRGNTTVFILWIYVIVSVIATSLAFVSKVYRSKDTTLLLSYPVKASDIYISKLIVQLVKQYKKAIYLIIPFLVGFYMQNAQFMQLDARFIFGAIGLFVFIPIIIVFFAGIFSIGLTYLDIFFNRFQLAKIIVLTLLGVGVGVLLLILVNQLPYNLPIRELWGQITDSCMKFVNRAIDFSFITRFAWYGMVGKSGLYYLVVIGVALVVVLINVFACYRLYYFLAYHPVKEIKKVRNIKSKTKQSKHIFLTFLKKEFKNYLRSENGIVSMFIYVIIMPLILYCLNRIFFSLDISATGYTIVLSVNVMIAITLLTASNISVANSLSSEGSEFYLLKVSPLDTKQIALAKMLMNFVLSGLSVIAMCIVLTSINAQSLSLKGVELISAKDLALITIIVLLVSYGHILWSLEFDITHCKVKQVIAGEKDNNNITKSIFAGLGIAVVITFATYFFTSLNVYGYNPYPLVSVLIIAVLIFASRLYLFICKLNAYFDDITF